MATARKSSKKPKVKNYKTVKVEIAGGMAKVIFNRPEKRNAMSPQLHRDMTAALDQVMYDDDARVLVLTGAGTSWCAGMDLKEYFYELQDKQKEWERVRRIADAWMTDVLQYYPKPTIAAVNGWVFGGAFVPLICCDIAIALSDAQFGLSEINFALVPGGTVSRMITDILPPRWAMYYALTGETMDGRQAEKVGLVNKAVDTEKELWTEVRRISDSLSAKQPAALQYTKELVRYSRRMDYQQAFDYAIAKVGQLTARTQGEWLYQGIERFKHGEFRPGLGHYDRSKNRRAVGLPKNGKKSAKKKR